MAHARAKGPIETNRPAVAQGSAGPRIFRRGDAPLRRDPLERSRGDHRDDLRPHTRRAQATRSPRDASHRPQPGHDDGTGNQHLSGGRRATGGDRPGAGDRFARRGDRRLRRRPHSLDPVHAHASRSFAGGESAAGRNRRPRHRAPAAGVGESHDAGLCTRPGSRPTTSSCESRASRCARCTRRATRPTTCASCSKKRRCCSPAIT